jgi:hypothetical protein
MILTVSNHHSFFIFCFRLPSDFPLAKSSCEGTSEGDKAHRGSSQDAAGATGDRSGRWIPLYGGFSMFLYVSTVYSWEKLLSI